jgi:hypothetical protein
VFGAPLEKIMTENSMPVPLSEGILFLETHGLNLEFFIGFFSLI